MAAKQRLYFSKTEREWQIITKRVNELGFSSVQRYINSRLVALKKDYEIQPIQVSKKALVEIEKKQYYVPDYINMNFIEEISNAINIPPSTIIDRIIITPLINER